MAIKRAYSKDTYTVARIINIDDGITVRTDLEYKRGEGSVVPDNLTSMLTSGGETSLLVNNNLYTKQAYPLVADAVQGYDSDYFMWTDIDNTARWYQAAGWRDWSRNGKDSYQQVLGTYDASFLNPALQREQDLTFCEIDNMEAAIGSTARVIDLKMATIELPHASNPNIAVPENVERYVYNLNGTTDFLQYNSLDTTSSETQINLKEGNKVSLNYKATNVSGGIGETLMNASEDKYISYPAFDLIMRVANPFNTGVEIQLSFKTSEFKACTLLAGTSANGDFKVELTDIGKLKVTAPALHGAGFRVGTTTLVLNQFNNVLIRWDFSEQELIMAMNGYGGIVGGINQLISTESDITIQTLGTTSSLVADFDGVIKDFIAIDLGSGGDILRRMDINESTGIVVQERENNIDGLRVNMDDSDIIIIVADTSYLISGVGSSGASLFIGEGDKFDTDNNTWIGKISFDDEEIDILTFITPQDNLFHKIDIECGDTCNIVRLGVDEAESLFYNGALYDFSVTKGKQTTVWEFKTYASLKQDPFTLTSLSFGFSTSEHTIDNWSLITTGQK